MSMQTVYEDVELANEQEDPWSESYAVQRITNDRYELMDILKPMSDDPRVKRFLMEYDVHYQMLNVSNGNRLSLRDYVRDLRANTGVSRAKSLVVEDIYKSTDEHIAQLRREINIVYHQLIEVQEAEDASRQTLAALTKGIATLNEKINERMRGVPQHQLKLKEKQENKYNDQKMERDKSVAEVERLRDEFLESTNQQARLEKDREIVDEKIAETNKEFVRVNSDIARENQKKCKIKAALEAGQERFDNREKDMQDLRLRLQQSKKQSKDIMDMIHADTVKVEKMGISIQMISSKIRNKQYEYEGQMQIVHQAEAELEQMQQELKKKRHELDVLKEQSAHVDSLRRILKNRVQETDHKKEIIIHRKEKEKAKNLVLMEEVVETKRNMEKSLKEHTDLMKLRDFTRKALMKEKATMQKDHTLLTLHQLANKRLNQDNSSLVAQGKEQRRVISKLENERDSYIKQAVFITRKAVRMADEERKSMEQVFVFMRKIAGEEMKMMETQNLYESTRNEHALYSRHILQLKDSINTLRAKAMSLTYETQKLLQERDYRDECLIKEELALQKLSRQIFILKVNLKDLKESNSRLKLIIENQDLEEKKLIKMTRVMKLEKIREVKGLERVVRDIDGLDLALTRRHHELHELYKTLKLKQSLLEKGENMYNVRWKDHVAITTSLQKAKSLRRLDQKNRKIVDRLMDCVQLRKTHLERIKLRNKGLTEELSHPRNIHRWRNLLGRDPEAYESVRNLHKLRHAIQEKVEVTTNTMSKIRILDHEYITLITTILTEPSPETVLQLKLYQEDLVTRYKQIKTLTEELRDALDSKSDMKTRREAVNCKVKQIHRTWFSHMNREKSRLIKETIQARGPLPFLTGPGLPSRAELALRMVGSTATNPTEPSTLV